MRSFTTRCASGLALMASACVLAMGAGSIAAAQEQAAPRTAFPKALGSQALSPETVMEATEIEIAPGHSSPSHRHRGGIYAYVLEGEIRSAIDGGDPVLYRTGDSWFEPDGAEHSFFENASDTERARFLAVRVGPPNTPPPASEEQ